MKFKHIKKLYVFAATIALTIDQVSIENLETNIRTLAKPEWEGRLAGSEGNRAARQWIISKFQQIGLKPMFKNQSYEQPIEGWGGLWTIGVNVIGYLLPPPDVPDRPPYGEMKCVIIGAHYDGKGQDGGKPILAADDNASGVAALLEIARLIRNQEMGLKTCVIFAAWDFEEGSFSTGGGVKGSKAFVDDPPIGLNKISLSVTFDLLGGHFFSGEPDWLFIFGTESAPGLKELIAPLDKSTSTLTPMTLSTAIIEPFGKFPPRSDYGPFRSRGIPHLFFTTGTPRYYHSAEDTPEVIDYRKLRLVTAYVFNSLWPILSGQRIISRSPTNATTYPEDLQNELKILETLIENAKSNGLSNNDVQTLTEDLETLKQLEKNSSTLKACHLQFPFFHIIKALGIRNASAATILFSLRELLGC